MAWGASTAHLLTVLLLPDSTTPLEERARTLAREASASGFATLDLSGAIAPHAAALRSAWADLERDPYLPARWGRRERRFAAFDLELPGGATRRLHDATHLQAPEHNRLFGGVERRFAPLDERVLARAPWRILRALWTDTLRALAGLAAGAWRLEVHAFRVMPEGAAAWSTPEGTHRDGRDWVFVMLVDRAGVTGGELLVEDAATGRRLAELPMVRPFELVLLDDRRVRHGATPVLGTGRRDALVATARRA